MQISGKITDATTGETLPRANIYFSDATGKYNPGAIGTTSDLSGQYSIVGQGSHLTASFTGFATKTLPASPGIINFALGQSATTLPEVVISAKMIWPRVLAALVISALIFFLYKALKK